MAYALSEEEIKLPSPQLEGKMSVEEALTRRRSRRVFKDHSLTIILEGDRRRELARACLRQRFIEDAPVSLIITAEFSRITNRYGKKGIYYAYMEAGHVGQNVYLQAESLGLGTVVIGAFYEEDVSQALNLPDQHIPLDVMPVGYY